MQYSNLDETLFWLERQTNLRTKLARMLSNGEQGRLLQTFSLMVRPKAILELGTFTGYSTLCLSRGVPPDGVIDTVEINDELEDLIREGFERGGISSKVNIHFSDAKEVIPTLTRMYDIVYIDGDKRDYCDYYRLVFDKVKVGGYIIADNVLWDGKVLMEHPPQDAMTQSIIAFNKMVERDTRVENVILPVRDGLNVIYKTFIS